MKPNKIKFVLLASQRTGSNFLNSLLNQYQDIKLHGEAFNGSFIGLLPEYYDVLGVERESIKNRDKDQMGFMNSLFDNTEAKAVGFHLFPNHAPTVLNKVLKNNDVVKVGLRRSVFPSFISLLEAQQTNVWLVGKEGNKKLEDKKPVLFDSKKFDLYKKNLDKFWIQIDKSLKETNQNIHLIYYSKLKNVVSINNLVSYLGVDEQKVAFKENLKKQATKPLHERVSNFKEMEQYAKDINLINQLY